MITGRVGCSLATGHAPQWVFVVGRAFLVAIPATTSQDVVDRLTAVVARDAIEIETVVSLIPLSGAEAVQSFIVIVVPGDRTANGGRATESASESASDRGADGVMVSAVIRGAIVADIYSVGGSRRFSDSDIRPWLLADFQSVIGVAISDPTAPVLSATDLRGGVRVESGVMPGQALYWASEIVAAELSTPDPHQASDLLSDLAAELAGGSSVPTAAASALGVAAATPALILAPESTPALESIGTVADTVLRAPALAPTRSGDADTVLSKPVSDADTVLSRPVAIRPPETASIPEIVPMTFRIAVERHGRTAGTSIELSAPCLVGRRPSAPRMSSGQHPQLVTVDSPTAAVSRTHIEIRQVGDSVVVTDLGSTNGTRVISLTGVAQRLQPRGSLTVLPGMRVDIGDGNIVQILPVDAASSRPPAHPHSERRHL